MISLVQFTVGLSLPGVEALSLEIYVTGLAIEAMGVEGSSQRLDPSLAHLYGLRALGAFGAEQFVPVLLAIRFPILHIERQRPKRLTTASAAEAVGVPLLLQSG